METPEEHYVGTLVQEGRVSIRELCDRGLHNELTEMVGNKEAADIIWRLNHAGQT